MDTGVCFDHPDLSPDPYWQCFGLGCKIVGGVNFLDPDDCLGEWPYGCCLSPQDDHGTKVAAAAVGLSNNWEYGTWDGGVAGVAGGDYSNTDLGALILAYRSLGPSYMSGQAIDHAVLSGADVLNMSFGQMWSQNSSWKSLWYPMINAFQQGVTMVAAMGNSYDVTDDLTEPWWPAAAEQGVVAVGASTYYDERVTWGTWGQNPTPWQSMYGSHIDVVAPGVVHWSADAMDSPCGSYPNLTEFGGTSCATALTSGVACLLLSENPLLTNEEVEGIIGASAKDLVYSNPVNVSYADPGWDEETGWGRVDAFQALMRLRAPYELQVRQAFGYDVMEQTGVTYEFENGGECDSLEQYRFLKTVGLGGDYFTEPPAVWGLSRVSSGACSLLTAWDREASPMAPELVMGHCKVVKGSITENSCDLKTFGYKWYQEEDGEWIYRGWLPTDPGLIGWHYELSGTVLDPDASSCTAVAMTQAPDGVPCLCPAADQDTLALLLHLVDNLGQPLAGVPSTDINIYVNTLSPYNSAPSFPEACQAYSESSHVYRPEEFFESDGNGDLLVTLPPTGGADERALWMVHVSGTDIGVENQAVRSVDMDADGDVDGVDFGSFASAYAAKEWAADLDGNWDVGPSDFSLFSSHYNHNCLSGARARGEHDDLEEQQGLVALLHSTPNPFAASADIAFAVGDATQRVSIKVYDLRGRLVQTLCDDSFESGLHTVSWDGRNEGGNQVASGVYFFRMESSGFRHQRKLVLLR
ncbi:MAG: S8 family serine peptidase [Candidatus Eisenbacteria bacterium]